MTVRLTVLLAVLVAVAGCQTSVEVNVAADENLNYYGGGPQSLDLYFMRVNDLARFQGANAAFMGQTAEKAVPGGISIGRYNVKPSEVRKIELGKQVDGYDHLGLYAGYRDPLNGTTAILRSVEIPSGGKILLRLGPRGIVEFAAD